MNRSILLVISDFLILSLLALARFDAPVTQDATPPSDTEARPGATLESELIDILKASLESEKEQQAALASELKAVQENVEAKDQDIVQLKRYDTMVEIGVGCDLYLPFFKLIPELKFCFSLTDALDKNHASQLKDETAKLMANSVRAGHAKMIVLTFYFE